MVFKILKAAARKHIGILISQLLLYYIRLGSLLHNMACQVGGVGDTRRKGRGGHALLGTDHAHYGELFAFVH